MEKRRLLGNVTALALVAALVVMAGCMAGDPLTRSEAEDTKRKESADKRDTEIGKTQPPTISQTNEGGADGQGGGGPQVMIMGDEALEQLSAVVKYVQASEEERQLQWDWKRSRNLTIIGFAVGLGLLALVVWFIWKKTAGVRAKLSAATAPITERIKAYMAQKSDETDPQKLADLNAKIAVLNSEKADIEKAMAKA